MGVEKKMGGEKGGIKEVYREAIFWYAMGGVLQEPGEGEGGGERTDKIKVKQIVKKEKKRKRIWDGKEGWGISSGEEEKKVYSQCSKARSVTVYLGT